MTEVDIVIVGAGIAGASLAAELASGPWRDRRILVLEAEDMPGRHATGRSAAFWDETYGGPDIQPLTTASRRFLEQPSREFADRPFLAPRGAAVVARTDDRAALDAFAAGFAGTGVALDRVGRAALDALVPDLRTEWTEAVLIPDCKDIDVAALHQAYLGAAKRAGVLLWTSAPLTGARLSGTNWEIDTPRGTVRSTLIINAAGAWADEVARLAAVMSIGLIPYRRTMLQLRLETAVVASLPLLMDVNGEFYVKGESEGRVWLSPHDEHETQPCDAAAEEIDIALAIARLESFVDWKIAGVERKWAGLRTFAPDRLPVIGFDPLAPGFFWFAGQGGFGIQTAPAMAALAGQLIAGGKGLHAGVADHVDWTPYNVDRFDI